MTAGIVRDRLEQREAGLLVVPHRSFVSISGGTIDSGGLNLKRSRNCETALEEARRDYYFAVRYFPRLARGQCEIRILFRIYLPPAE